MVANFLNSSVKPEERVLYMRGGGNRGAFYGGVFKEFHRLGINYSHFGTYVGVSVGAVTIPFWLTGQIDQGLEYFLRHLLRKGYAKKKWWGRPYADMKYIEDAFRSSSDALDVEILKQRKEKLYIAVSDPSTLEGHFECLNTHPDPVLLMLKAILTPFFAEPAMLDGECWYDGGLTEDPPIRCPLPFKPKELWYVTPYPKGYQPKPWLMYGYYALVRLFGDRQASRLIARAHARECERNEEMERRATHIIRPKKKLPVSWRTTNPNAMKAAIRIGEEAARECLEAYSG